MTITDNKYPRQKKTVLIWLYMCRDTTLLLQLGGFKAYTLWKDTFVFLCFVYKFNFLLIFLMCVFMEASTHPLFLPSFSYPSNSLFAPPPSFSSCGAWVQTEFLWAKSGCLDWAVCQSGPSKLWYSYFRNFPLLLFTSPVLCSHLPGLSRCFFYYIRLKGLWN